ncbi:hypothetical protein HMPREF1210_01001 [Paenisporosarcina sp. HGH0030]|uniref:hypothetical protein n=1 Tax=Paenisporosarcina sp. HGH0030 TaxID=1078085 RepID=UPI00034E131B|nr:hypothetical protein [Paenisporosarcina sp. HGH0030]EPD53270.1 hypothetical protein HMPREF1210_01001 [Paenisporosarcina sp. HGH0030]
MVYNAKGQRGVIGFLFAMMMGLLISNITGFNFSKGLLYFQIVVLVFLVVSFFIRYKFEINDGFLTYQPLFLAIPLYKKVIYPNQIIKIKFKRLGWTNKGAIIKIKKGFNIHVVNFEPDNVFIDLINFTNKNSISILKTKDYLILEKMK